MPAKSPEDPATEPASPSAASREDPSADALVLVECAQPAQTLNSFYGAVSKALGMGVDNALAAQHENAIEALAVTAKCVTSILGLDLAQPSAPGGAATPTPQKEA